MNGFYKEKLLKIKKQINCSTPLVTCQHANVAGLSKAPKSAAVVASGAWEN